jgi:opacity protein-like surface antigen
MRNISFAALLAALALAVPQAAGADEAIKPYYIAFKYGGYVPSSDYTNTSGITAEALKASPVWEGAVGWAPQFFGLELSGGRKTTSAAGLDVTLWPVLLTARLQLPLGPLAAYALAGGGYYFNSADLSGVSLDKGEWGYHAGLGLDFNLGLFLIGAEARYAWVEPDFGGTVGKVNLDGFDIFGKVGLRF